MQLLRTMLLRVSLRLRLLLSPPQLPQLVAQLLVFSVVLVAASHPSLTTSVLVVATRMLAQRQPHDSALREWSRVRWRRWRRRTWRGKGKGAGTEKFEADRRTCEKGTVEVENEERRNASDRNEGCLRTGTGATREERRECFDQNG